MTKEKSWQEFRDTGLAVIINQILHIFGWAIVFEVDDNNIATRCYPARVKYRGFTGDETDKAYLKVSQYMEQNAKELLEETKTGGYE
jgi:hypothetical protein